MKIPPFGALGSGFNDRTEKLEARLITMPEILTG
jgi:hypothetical protein